MVAFRNGVTDDSADDTDGGGGGPDGGGEARHLVMGAVAVRAINSTIEPGSERGVQNYPGVISF